MTTQKKISIVQNLTDKLSRAKAIVLSDYRGLTHKQLESLKKILKTKEAEFVVFKNSLFLKAISDSAWKEFVSSLKTELHGPTAGLFAYADEVAPLKDLMKFVKTNSLPKIKFGFLGNQKITEEEITRIAKLPAREILLTQLVDQMKSPLFGLHRALSWNLQKFVVVLSQIKK